MSVTYLPNGVIHLGAANDVISEKVIIRGMSFVHSAAATMLLTSGTSGKTLLRSRVTTSMLTDRQMFAQRIVAHDGVKLSAMTAGASLLLYTQS